MVTDYYMDESGNTGDLTLDTPNFRFDNQPFFTLSCVGIEHLETVEKEVHRLKNKYKIQADELKFSSVKKKPMFVRELLIALIQSRCPIMIESTDKRYFLSINIIECMVMPSRSPIDYSSRARWIKNIMAEYLAMNIPNRTLAVFANACQVKSREALRVAYTELRSCILSKPLNDVAISILHSLDVEQEAFEKATDESPEAIMNFLPIPDVMRNGKEVSILPHVSSLAHIYGRVNHLHDGDLKGVKFYHDEQMQFDSALRDVMRLLESKIGKSVPSQSFANFNIKTPAKMFFLPSSNIGIQVADVFAGSISHCMTSIIGQRRNLHQDWKGLIQDLGELNNSSLGDSLNLVVPIAVKKLFDLVN